MGTPPLRTLAEQLAYALFIYETSPDKDYGGGLDYAPPLACPNAFHQEGEALASILEQWSMSNVPAGHRDHNERRRLVLRCAEALRQTRQPLSDPAENTASGRAWQRLGLVAVHSAEFTWRGQEFRT